MITMGAIQITGIRDVYLYSQILRSTDQLDEFLVARDLMFKTLLNI